MKILNLLTSLFILMQAYSVHAMLHELPATDEDMQKVAKNTRPSVFFLVTIPREPLTTTKQPLITTLPGH